ncbi:MAG: hypothetical protein GX029_07130 [Pseudomonadaceae bacterium]|nr:hypothetical protein [Pseudomonadaceae bacterium]
MERQYMTLGYYSGFDKLFKPTFEVMDYLKNPIWGDTKVIRELVKDKVIRGENDLEGLANHLRSNNILHLTGHLVEGIILDRAMRERVHIELPLREDEKRFGMAWSTINKLDTTNGRLRRDVKLPIGMFEKETALIEILRGLKPVFPLFDLDLALTDGVNKMLIIRREELLQSKD